MTCITDTAEPPLTFHVFKLYTYIWHCMSEFSPWKLCCHGHTHCDKYISMCSLLKAMNQSSLRAIKAERGCDYYCTKYYVVRVPFFCSAVSFTAGHR